MWQRFINQLIPFIFIGVSAVAFAFGIFLLAYLFLFGALIGLILFLTSWLGRKIFPSKVPLNKKNQGRIIDSDDWKKL